MIIDDPMNRGLTRKDRRTLKKIFRRIVSQGYHEERITEIYQLLYNAAREEFFDDNKTTIDDFMASCHKHNENYFLDMISRSFDNSTK